MGKTAIAGDDIIEMSDIDRDSLHVLPLSILPLKTPGLKRARMVKNQALEGAVELFASSDAGSGQISVADLHREFSWKQGQGHPDVRMLRKLASLHSYDVYSLRITLRDLEIDVENQADLKLSQSMNAQLAKYMASFTRPLLRQIYGNDDLEIQSFTDVLTLFRDPNPRAAMDKLTKMADKLGMTVVELPRFIEDYGDIYLSLAYYRKCLNGIDPIASEFLRSINELRGNYAFKNDTTLINAVDIMERTVGTLSEAINSRLAAFDQASDKLWENLSADHFKKVKKMIEAHHVYVGGILCALSVKMTAWDKKFPNPRHGGPQTRAEFLLSEMKQGIGRIREILRTAPRDIEDT